MLEKGFLSVVVSDKIVWAFNMSEATQPAALDISKAFNRI